MEEAEPKWEGKATAELRGLKAQEVWPLIEDFCGLGKWLPTIDTCYLLEGTPDQPGLVRYCASEKLSFDGSKEVNIMWAKEKLIAIDPIGKWLSYEILDNNVGFRSYVATIKVLPMDNDDKCMIEWSFVSDPIEGWGLEHLISYIDNSLQGMAKKMEEALQVKGNA